MGRHSLSHVSAVRVVFGVAGTKFLFLAKKITTFNTHGDFCQKRENEEND